MKLFNVRIHVHGFYEAEVAAESMDDAVDIAREELEDGAWSSSDISLDESADDPEVCEVPT